METTDETPEIPSYEEFSQLHICDKQQLIQTLFHHYDANTICSKLSVNRSTLYRWIDSDEDRYKKHWRDKFKLPHAILDVFAAITHCTKCSGVLDYALAGKDQKACLEECHSCGRFRGIVHSICNNKLREIDKAVRQKRTISASFAAYISNIGKEPWAEELGTMYVWKGKGYDFPHLYDQYVEPDDCMYCYYAAEPTVPPAVSSPVSSPPPSPLATQLYTVSTPVPSPVATPLTVSPPVPVPTAHKVATSSLPPEVHIKKEKHISRPQLVKTVVKSIEIKYFSDGTKEKTSKMKEILPLVVDLIQ